MSSAWLSTIARALGEISDTSPPVGVRSLAQRYRTMHFALGKRAKRMASHLPIIKMAVAGSDRMAPVDLRILPDNASQPLSGVSGAAGVRLGTFARS